MLCTRAMLPAPAPPADAWRGLRQREEHGSPLLRVARRGGRGVLGRGEERVAELAEHARAEADDYLVLCPRWGVSLGGIRMGETIL
jgi:hypothetical protein